MPKTAYVKLLRFCECRFQSFYCSHVKNGVWDTFFPYGTVILLLSKTHGNISYTILHNHGWGLLSTNSDNI